MSYYDMFGDDTDNDFGAEDPIHWNRELNQTPTESLNSKYGAFVDMYTYHQPASECVCGTDGDELSLDVFSSNN